MALIQCSSRSLLPARQAYWLSEDEAAGAYVTIHDVTIECVSYETGVAVQLATAYVYKANAELSTGKPSHF
jgi:hypothetical protein